MIYHISGYCTSIYIPIAVIAGGYFKVGGIESTENTSVVIKESLELIRNIRIRIYQLVSSPT